MALFRADLHMHSCLSPCASIDSSPRAMAKAARLAGLNLVALTDHNLARNCPAFESACHYEGLTAVFGVEVTCAEEAHCLALFPTAPEALDFGEYCYDHLAKVVNKADKFGDQIWVNEDEEIEGEAEYLLINATDLSLSDLGVQVYQRGGLFIPAHVDRSSMSLVSQLGCVPPGNYHALELYLPQTRAADLGLSIEECPVFICNSDAHFSEDVGKRHFCFEAQTLGFDGLRKALLSAQIERHYRRP